MINKKIFWFGMILIFGILLVLPMLSSFTSSNPQTTAFGANSADYLASQGIQLYGTGISEQCGAGQDFVLQVHPFGCSPTIVTSNLLEEQNVPVFCPIVATQINPLIDIKAIDSMSFTGSYPKEVSGVGFHPAQAAVRSTINLVNYPILENVGYVVIVLKRNANESSMPEYVSGNLTARIRYDIANAFGIGDTSFSVPLISDAEWEDRYKEFSFWNGKGFLKVEDIYENSAVVGVYEDANRRISSFTLGAGQISNKIYLAGSYCLSSMQLRLDSLENPDTRVRLKIDEDGREVKQGERFLENRCVINSISKQGLVKSVTGRCTDDNGKRIDLNFKVSPRVELKVGEVNKGLRLGDKISSLKENYYIINIDTSKKGNVFNENLQVWIAKLNDNEIKNYAGGGVLNARGINFYYNLIKTSRDSYKEGKLGKKDIWRLDYLTAVNIDNTNIKLNGFAGGNYGGSETALGDLSSTTTSTTSSLTTTTTQNYNSAISGYENVAKNYPNEGQADKYGTEVKGANKYAEKGLKLAIKLAGDFRDFAKRTSLVALLLRKYNTKENQLFVSENVKGYFDSDSNSLTSASVFISGKYRQISFVDVYEPSFEDYGVDVVISGTGAPSGVQSLTKDAELTFPVGVVSQTITGANIKESIKLISITKSESKAAFSINYLSNNKLIPKQDFLTLNIVKKIGTHEFQLISILDNGVSINIDGNEIPLLLEDKNNLYQIPSSSTSSATTAIKDKFIVLKDLDEQYATFQTNFQRDTAATTKIKVGESVVIGNYNVVLNKIHLNKLARLSVLTNIDRAGTTANVSFNIPIEKRSIDLSPKKIDEMIKNLNKTINGWEDKSEKLGKVVDGMQKACIATMGALAVKSLFVGGGAVAAREKTMNSVNIYCQEEITKGEKGYKNLRDCINNEGTKIEQLQKANEEVIKQQEEKRKYLEGKTGADYTTELGNQVANTDTKNKETINKAVENKLISDEGLRDLENCNLLKNKLSNDDYKRQCGTFYENRIKELNENLKNIEITAAQKAELEDNGVLGKATTSFNFAAEGVQTGRWAGGDYDTNKIKKSDGTLFYTDKDIPTKKNIQFFNYNSGWGGNKKYVAILGDSPNSDGEYVAEKVCEYSLEGGLKINENSCIQDFGSFKKVDSFTMPITNPQVQYFGTAPDKDYPAIVPFPFPGIKNTGYYVGIRHATSGSATTASGIAKSYWVCNAGDDAIVNFQTGSNQFTGGDACAQFRIEAGNIVGGEEMFGLTKSQNSQLAVTAERAIREAESKFGKKGGGDILGMPVSFGNPVFDVPELQCENFMSPKDCDWLFNLCDPVICPSSRCDAGGTAPQADVVQSGIIGSLLLCLPNFNPNPTKGVLIPVCLTGLKAGIDGYLSIIKGHRDCLIEKQQTGANVGICDEVYSVYLCEFFWQQAMPLKDIIIPKILDFFTSGSLRQRGGGEYAGGSAVWTNAKNSMNYFTRTYATNAYNAFKVKAVNELKNEVCKNSISGVFPEIGVLESMTEPSSPPQFHAKFEELPFTDATIPPTSQYRVFYHIFAGKTAGVNYQVYLREPDAKASIYSVNPIYFVAGGYIGIGKTASETKDFTAPAGYTKLCVRVNNQEECDFKIVSSSYAVDYVTDSIVSNQATESNIKTEAECTSGSNSISSFINPNIQSGASEYLHPDIYQKGLVRICSSLPPDGKKELSRWKPVGICDDKTVTCWIDTDSIKDAIEIKGIQEDTLQKVTAASLDRMISKGYMKLSEYNSEVAELNKLLSGSINDLEKISSRIIIDENGEISSNGKKVLFSWQNAELLLIKSMAYDKLARIERWKIPLVAVSVGSIQVTSNSIKIKSAYYSDKTGHTNYLNLIYEDGRSEIVKATGFLNTQTALLDNGQTIKFVAKNQQVDVVVNSNTIITLQISAWGDQSRYLTNEEIELLNDAINRAINPD